MEEAGCGVVRGDIGQRRSGEGRPGPGTYRAQMHVKAWSSEDLRSSRRWHWDCWELVGERWARDGPMQGSNEQRCLGVSL